MAGNPSKRQEIVFSLAKTTKTPKKKKKDPKKKKKKKKNPPFVYAGFWSPSAFQLLWCLCVIKVWNRGRNDLNRVLEFGSLYVYHSRIVYKHKYIIQTKIGTSHE